MILNSFITKKGENLVMDEDNKPKAEETSVVPETGNGAGDVETESSEDNQGDPVVTTEEETQETDVKLDSKDPKKTYDKLRSIAEAAVKEKKAVKEQIDRLQAKLKEKEESEAKSKGEWKELYEKALQDLVVLKQENGQLQEKITSETKSAKKSHESLNKTLNEMINLQMESWPEEAVALVDEADNAEERFRQFSKAAKLVSTFVNSSAKPKLGLAPSPKDVREEGKEKLKDPTILKQALRATNMYSG